MHQGKRMNHWPMRIRIRDGAMLDLPRLASYRIKDGAGFLLEQHDPAAEVEEDLAPPERVEARRLEALGQRPDDSERGPIFEGDDSVAPANNRADARRGDDRPAEVVPYDDDEMPPLTDDDARPDRGADTDAGDDSGGDMNTNEALF